MNDYETTVASIIKHHANSADDAINIAYSDNCGMYIADGAKIFEFYDDSILIIDGEQVIAMRKMEGL